MRAERWSEKELRLIAIFAREPAKKLHGYALHKSTKMGIGTLYPILYRFAQMGLLDAEREAPDPTSARSRRTLYRITPKGVEAHAGLLMLLQ